MGLSLPAHAHMFAEPGCFDNYDKPNVECGSSKKSSRHGETRLPDNFVPIKFDGEKEKPWNVMMIELRAEVRRRAREHKEKIEQADKEKEEKKEQAEKEKEEKKEGK